GLRFNHDATYELTKGELSMYEPPAMLPHPIVQHLPLFLVATSSSMDVAVNSEAVITGYGLKAMAADYSQDNFFPAVPNAPDMEFGPMLQGAASRYGRGRVAAFADSTVFSNFWMFMPGKPELALSYMDWLNRENAVPNSRWVVIGLALLLSMLAWRIGRRLSFDRWVTIILLAGLVAVPVAIRGYGLMNRVAYALPSVRSEFVSVCFEREYSEFTLPDSIEGFMAPATGSLQTFIVWNQRLAYVPSIRDTLDEALRGADVLVVANPASAPDSREIELVGQFVAEGGRLLVMGDSETADSANAFLDSFGMSIEPLASGGVRVYRLSDAQELALTPSGATVVGGEELITTVSGEPVCSYVRSGDGGVAAFADSGLFMDSSLGNVSRVPDDRQMTVSRIEFDLMRFLADDTTPGF
ncbi:MAG: hypothetical protein PF636_00315, partial [Actinomycetota bacterium]|nr:hypothetical protein [Actinomycetota bacterium]